MNTTVPLEGALSSEKLNSVRPTFDNQRHYGLGHAKQVAGYAAVGSIIFTTGIGDGQNGTVRTNFGVDCRDKENIRPAEKGKKNR